MSAASVTAFPRRTPPTILVVEDDVLIRALISDGLRAQGFRVLEASSADDAITVLDSVRVDLLFVDIHLPGLRNGLDVARHVQARGIPTQMILTSGKSDASAVPDLDDFGPFVRKPYLVSRVVSLVSDSLNWPDAPQA
ncbi:response regulator [Microvirga lotononidis]|uniref:Response regulator with CheY-like receiver, AAA-type ATPase, and DNA-binding domains n=1 Tax=Microvirga lotononidis TaxID=864069 RepID=I4YSA6_9HYPH|nr:response regulator [Microvirga lotononidis]EIM26848.1 response regulator with CheY-like receiver, AAA-type ATPase, and DNA-binding domains [Microvirga lotononidis]WQO31404.1 response regulator [Microvirga lotononidis]